MYRIKEKWMTNEIIFEEQSNRDKTQKVLNSPFFLQVSLK